MDPSTLFLAFYYKQGRPEQYLAARELKRGFWRYHKKYNAWFQRHENPTVSTDKYEKGKYLVFECGQDWTQKIKADFTFEYEHLENEVPTS
mmetsp:Transcript_18276/g.45710  ORF Transcript_18276/g.45710 Transcript_18276/m.45710 type:complete len:91 (+) Transcript_18276:314-586(+)